VLKLLEEGNLESTENDFCTKHRERLQHYCFTDNQPLCIVCAEYENHNKHDVKLLKDIFEEQSKLTKDIKERLTEVMRSIEMGFFKLNVEAILR